VWALAQRIPHAWRARKRALETRDETVEIRLRVREVIDERLAEQETDELANLDRAARADGDA